MERAVLSKSIFLAPGTKTSTTVLWGQWWRVCQEVEKEEGKKPKHTFRLVGKKASVFDGERERKRENRREGGRRKGRDLPQMTTTTTTRK